VCVDILLNKEDESLPDYKTAGRWNVWERTSRQQRGERGEGGHQKVSVENQSL
jgi:hypothetical protein